MKHLNALRVFILFVSISCYVATNAQPIAGFVSNVTQACEGTVVSFTNTSSGASSFKWFLGDNDSTFTTNPSKFFNVPGVKNIILIASNGFQEDTATLQLSIFRKPIPQVTIPKDTVCVNERAWVNTNTILGDAPLTTCFIDFGENNAPGSVITTCSDTFFEYRNSGCKQIALFVVDGNGCNASLVLPAAICVRRKPVACFGISQYDSCSSPQSISFTNCSFHETPGTPIAYQWSFGSTQPVPPNRNFTCGVDTVRLRANDARGCRSDTFRVVKINCVTAGFTMPTNTPCRFDSLRFTNTSTPLGTTALGTPTFQWNFGDNNVSTQVNPTHVYKSNGTFTVRLTARLNGCTSVFTQTVTVTDSIPINFTATPTQRCVPPLTVNFTSTAPGAAPGTCFWTFGDGIGQSPLCNPSYTYNQSGCFDVTFSAGNGAGCVSTRTKKNFVCIQSFSANIGASVLTGCAPLTVDFSNNTQVNQPIINCDWGFGDGTFALGNCSGPSKVYSNPGTYNVWLRVETADGCFDTARRTITVTPRPSGDFNASPRVACLKEPIQFNCVSCVGATSYFWEFGPGTSTQQNPSHTYEEIGFHTVSLNLINGTCTTTVTKNNFIESLVPKADFTIARDCATPTTVTLTSISQGADSTWWRLGDGSPTQLGVSVTHTYPSTTTSYFATVYVKNFATGCIDSLTRRINFSAPNKNFGANRLTGCVGTQIQFRDSTSFGSAWLWSFGDGNTSTLRNPSHSYNLPGQYTVKLIIDPGTPCEDSIVKPLFITISRPIAEFTATPRSGCRPLTVQFTDQSVGQFAAITDWQWRFGGSGSATSSDQNPTHTFTETANSYDIRLIVTDANGCSRGIVKDNYIRMTVIQPNFTFSSPRCPGRPVTFTNTTPQPAGMLFEWDFGDGNIVTSTNASFTFSSNGIMPVKLTAKRVVGNDTCEESITRNVNVQGVGVDFSATTDFPCPPAPVVFQNLTTDPDVTFRWYFGNGRTSTEINPIHIYYFPGEYDITLVGEKSNGCKDSLIKRKYIRILGPRLEDVQFDPPFGCRPLTVNFSGKIYETEYADLIWSPGKSDTISIVYGDTLYYTTQYVYADSLTESGVLRPVLVLEDDKGCRVPYPLIDSVYVDEYPHPNQNDTSVCIGAVVDYQLPDGDFFHWQLFDNPLCDTCEKYLSCDTCMFVVANAPDTISYIITATTIWGCVAKDTITLNVEDLPKLDAGPDFKLCRGETRVVPVGDVYNALWSPPTNVSSVTSLAPTVFASDNTTWIIYSENRLGNREGCYVYDTLTMTVIDTVRTLPLPDTSICAGESLRLDLTVVDASINDTNFYWFPASYLDNPNQEDPIATPPFSMDFRVIITSPLCEPDTHTFFVRVDPLPEVELYRDTIIAVGSELDLSALTNDGILFEWSSNDPLTCYDCQTPVLSATFTQWIYVTVTNQFGCKNIDSAYIRVLPCTPDFVFVPTAFTPNGDGLNDVLFVRGKALAEVKTFIVSNRWGNVVYSSNNIKDGWDGTYRGQLAPTDAYVWYVKAICTNGGEVEKKGTVTLIR